MWNISKQARKKFERCHTLPIHESDEEWEITLRDAKEEGEDLISRLQVELEEVCEVLLQTLPPRFIPYVENGTLNQPTLSKSVREDYVQWMQESSKEFEQILDAAYEQTAIAVTFLSESVQEVFEESLHDSTIERIEREGDTLHLYINTDGGFSLKALIHFTFENVITEDSDVPLEIGHWIVYYELQKTHEGFAFRVLFDCPDTEWTITMRSLSARYFYRPALYTKLNDEEKIDEISFEDYIFQLNPDFRYWLSTPHITSPIESFKEIITLDSGLLEFDQNEMIVSVGSERFTYDLEEFNPVQFIYTDIKEDPYEYLSQPLAIEEIESAALGDNLELQVRAWNTMYANPKEIKDIINRILTKMEITEENEMLAYVYVNHFYQNGVLIEAVIEKYRSLIE